MGHEQTNIDLILTGLLLSVLLVRCVGAGTAGKPFSEVIPLKPGGMGGNATLMNGDVLPRSAIFDPPADGILEHSQASRAIRENAAAWIRLYVRSELLPDHLEDQLVPLRRGVRWLNHASGVKRADDGFMLRVAIKDTEIVQVEECQVLVVVSVFLQGGQPNTTGDLRRATYSKALFALKEDILPAPPESGAPGSMQKYCEANGSLWGTWSEMAADVKIDAKGNLASMRYDFERYVRRSHALWVNFVSGEDFARFEINKQLPNPRAVQGLSRFEHAGPPVPTTKETVTPEAGQPSSRVRPPRPAATSPLAAVKAEIETLYRDSPPAGTVAERTAAVDALTTEGITAPEDKRSFAIVLVRLCDNEPERSIRKLLIEKAESVLREILLEPFPPKYGPETVPEGERQKFKVLLAKAIEEARKPESEEFRQAVYKVGDAVTDYSCSPPGLYSMLFEVINATSTPPPVRGKLLEQVTGYARFAVYPHVAELALDAPEREVRLQAAFNLGKIVELKFHLKEATRTPEEKRKLAFGVLAMCQYEVDRTKRRALVQRAEQLFGESLVEPLPRKPEKPTDPVPEKGELDSLLTQARATANAPESQEFEFAIRYLDNFISDHPSPEVFWLVSEAIASMSYPPIVREKLFNLLRWRGTADAYPYLAELAQDDADGLVRGRAARGIQNIIENKKAFHLKPNPE